MIPPTDSSEGTASAAKLSAEQTEAAMDNFTLTVFMHITFPAAAIWHGFAFFKLWTWIIVPALDTKPLEYWQAVGAMMVFRFLCPGGSRSDNSKRHFGERLMFTVFNMIFTPTFFLFWGWILKCFFLR